MAINIQEMNFFAPNFLENPIFLENHHHHGGCVERSTLFKVQLGQDRSTIDTDSRNVKTFFQYFSKFRGIFLVKSYSQPSITNPTGDVRQSEAGATGGGDACDAPRDHGEARRRQKRSHTECKDGYVLLMETKLEQYY